MERLKTVLPDFGNGSRIIITTRSSELATESAHHVHKMRLLDDDESWNVHQLSTSVVSGILALDQSEVAWDDVLANIKLASGKVDEIVYLSYVYLPHHLRPCLLYLGIYPQGLSIYVSTLVRLWVAEGFVNESSEHKSLEETGQGLHYDIDFRHIEMCAKIAEANIY